MKLGWGIAGTGAIARRFAEELPHSRTGRLAAVGSRSLESAREFARKHGGTPHGSFAELLTDPEVRAVYIASPHPMHPEMAIAAAEAGRHVLCEKPVALNASDAMRVIEAARRNGVFFMEAFMYRCHPRTRLLWELVAGGAIGRVKLIEATFSFAAPYRPESRLFDPFLGGGAILDIGCYTTSVARLVAGAASGAPFLEPSRVCGAGILCGTGVDEVACATLEFANGVVAQLGCAVSIHRGSELRVTGENGALLLPNFWNPPGPILCFDAKGAPAGEHLSDPNPHKYAVEADAVADALPGVESPAVPWADTLGNMETLDRWREAVGVSYPGESPEAPGRKTTIGGHPLRPGRFPQIPKAPAGAIGPAVSKLVLGCDNQRNYPRMEAMADDFLERGGNAFDTAFIYGNGTPERLLGHWIENRGIRKDVVIIVKGAHTPFCTPEHLFAQFRQSLDRLRTDYADLYLMHRDNPDIPAAVFFDALDSLRTDGCARAVGVSNWKLERVVAANRRAAELGRPPLDAVSNNFSLARMVEPVWAGCEAASEPGWRAWLAETRTPLFAWSSQARGYFLEGSLPADLAREVSRCWDSPENRARRERAAELAERKGVSAMNIALAYVLAQPFPVFALIGPRASDETRTSLPALGVRLDPAELEWLEHGG